MTKIDKQLENLEKEISEIEAKKCDLLDKKRSLQKQKVEEDYRNEFSETYWKYNYTYVYIKKITSIIDKSKCYINFEGLKMLEYEKNYCFSNGFLEYDFFKPNTTEKISKEEFDKIYNEAFKNIDNSIKAYEQIKNS